MSRPARAAVALSVVALGACSPQAAEDCTQGAPSLALDVVVATAGPASLVLELGAFATHWTRTYEVSGLGPGGVASLSLLFENPTPAGPFALDLRVLSHAGPNGTGAVLEEGSRRLTLTADACNRAELPLAAAGAPDAGAADAGLGPGDARGLDAEAADPDAGRAEADAESGRRDSGPEDTGQAADADTPDAGAPDAAPPRDAGAPMGDAGANPRDASSPADGGPAPADAGSNPDGGSLPSFPYVPSNSPPSSVAIAGPGVLLNCGETVFDSSTLQFTNPCGFASQPVVTPQPPVLGQPAGPELVTLVTADLTIGPGSRLRLVGGRPVRILAWGDVAIAGELIADADGSANGSGIGQCTPGHGGAGGSRVTGGGGGGGGFGVDGGRGGGNAVGDLGGDRGAESGNHELVPLRGGCPGGPGGNMGGGGGGGGGAVQLSAAGELRVEGAIAAGGGGGGGAELGAGGGGGGSGGAVLLEGVRVVVSWSGRVAVYGGGGGEGGTAVPGRTSPGGNATPSGAGLGGSGHNGGGNGGDGAEVGGAGDGNRGSVGGGGGGGGGGTGRVRVNALVECEILGLLDPWATSNGGAGCP